jgi:hypothetical protein
MKRVALTIGNNNYENLPHLRSAIPDVMAVSDTLTGVGFEVTSITDANRRDMNRALAAFAQKLQAADAGLFWFAGHGVQFNNRNYLLPIDIEIGDATDLPEEAFDLDRVLGRLGGTQANPLLLFVDACRIDGSQYFQTYHRGIGLTTGFTTLSSPPNGFMVIFSAGAGQVALDRLGAHDENPHSLFTREVLPLFRTPGITISAAVRQAGRRVREKARSVGSEQAPAVYDQTDGDFCLQPVQPVHQTAPARAGEQLLTVHRIRGSDEPEFSKFLDLMRKAFPNPALRDPDEDLQRWLEDAPEYMAQQTPVDDLYVIAKHTGSGTATGLVFASHYPTLEFMFIHYLVHDEQLATEARLRGDLALADEIRENSARMLFENLQTTTQWRGGILTELTNDNSLSELALIQLFRLHGRRLFNSKPYKIDVEYVQPSLDPLSEDFVMQSLMFMPSAEDQKLIDENNGCLPKNRALDILSFIYRYVYGGNFKTTPKYDDKYRSHVADIMELLAGTLPERVPLRERW